LIPADLAAPTAQRNAALTELRDLLGAATATHLLSAPAGRARLAALAAIPATARDLAEYLSVVVHTRNNEIAYRRRCGAVKIEP
jgi:hypothetical protein